MPLLLFTASMEGNYQIASITALILLVPSVAFMLVIEKFLRADVLAKVGPVKARFRTRIAVSNLNPPESYTLSGEGRGGAAGFASGSADVSLEATDDGTVLRYAASVQPGGKIAQVGSRLIGGTARKIGTDFFSRFVEVVTPEPPSGEGGPDEQEE
jgi:carbon monoxide dehydrogenase subunit G